MPRLVDIALPVALLLAGAACSQSDDSEEDDANLELQSAPLSYVGDKVVAALSDQSLVGLKDRTWAVTGGNRLPEGWLLPTVAPKWWGDQLASLPTATDCKSTEPGCDPDFAMRTCEADAQCSSGTCVAFEPTVRADGDAPKKMCVGYGDWFEDEVYRAIASAEHHVDITSLWLPADRWVPAVRNALARLAARGKPITVRILAGDATDLAPMAASHNAAALESITKGLPANAPLRIYIGEHSAGLLSWNHSKIVAVDGKYALVGGHNMHTDVYQLKDPVSDLTMKLTGPAATHAHRYASEVWKVACDRGWVHGLGLATYPAGLACPGDLETPNAASEAPGDKTIISVGRLGATAENASDAALLAMVDAAKERVVMSQEDLLGGRVPKTSLSLAAEPTKLFERLGAAIGRGVDVYLVISNVDGELFTTGYSHGWTAEETAQHMATAIEAKRDLFPAGTDVRAALCSKLHVAGIRLSDAARWPDGKVFSNHSKFLMIDRQAFYVGSQNLYTSDLAEYGFIVDSAEAAKLADETLWAPLWKYSKNAAASGSEVTNCPFKK